MVEGGAELGRTFEALDLAEHGRRTGAERIGGPMPGKIVKVWLITVTIFQQCGDKDPFVHIPVHGEARPLPVM
ncbi:MAG: hypothetical protein A49_19440 [Methyloceanibacter sp.]|nr:MAG: hypothetical protein A49_19440 [Methyloceanibacter sp.]